MINAAQIDCEKLYANVDRIARMLPASCCIAAVIKGDAYGHGLRGIVQALEPVDAIAMFVVASLEEALAVRRAGSLKKILILDRILVGEVRSCLQERKRAEQVGLIEQLVFSAYTPGDVEKFGALGVEYGVCVSMHLRLDFSAGIRGMNREDFLTAGLQLLEGQSGVEIRGVYAHVYAAYTSKQDADWEIANYIEAFDQIPPSTRKALTLHLLSSVSYFRYPEATLDMVRIGVSLYGLPVWDPVGCAPAQEPILSIHARVVSCVHLTGRSQVDYTGYLPEWVKRVALISIGSWDLPNYIGGRWSGYSVRIGTHLCPIVGTPCMDTCCVDITDIEDIAIGDEVLVLADAPGVSLSDWLRRTHFGYEDCQMLFAGMQRLPKLYISSL